MSTTEERSRGLKNFITLEGIEGSGKTTNIGVLAGWLRQRGFRVLTTREPGGTRLGEEVRRILLGTEAHNLSPLTELFLIEASRAHHVEAVIRPALEEGQVVVCDRFCDATLAYQGYGRGLDLEVIKQLNNLAVCGTFPGLTILLDCPPSLGLERSMSRLNHECKIHSEGRFELLELEFHQRVRKGYLEIASRESHRFRIIDSTLPLDVVSAQLIRCVEEYLGG